MTDKEDMFDAHSYNKGGSVLHMLRAYLGDDAFFAALKKYLTDNEYSAVEVDELRIAFEDTTGEDLNWFFDQWYLAAGHPELKLETGYADGRISVTVEQTQDTENNVPAIFRLPTQVAIYTGGATTPEMHDIVVDERKQTFTFPSAVAPDVVVFDPHHTLLARFDYSKSTEELAAQFKGATSLIDRVLVVQRLAGKPEGPGKEQTMTMALRDPFYGVRSLAMSAVNPTPEQLGIIERIARTDPHGGTRAQAVIVLGGDTGIDDEIVKSVATDALTARPYPVVAAGLEVLAEKDLQAAIAAARELEAVDNDDIAGALATLYAEAGDTSKLTYFEDRMGEVDGNGAIDLMRAYQSLLAQADDRAIQEGVAKMKAQALLQTNSPYRRIAAMVALNDLRESNRELAEGAQMVEQLSTIIKEIKAAETEPQLQAIYQQFTDQ